MDPCRFYPQTERVYWLTRDDSDTQFNNDDKLTDWWQVAPVGANGAHTRSYPVEIPSRLLRASHAVFVYEPFTGSGTTFIAAEQLGRLCYGLEIEPKYVAVCLQRMKDMGLEPRLAS